MKKIGILFFGVFFIAGCYEKIPEVSDENCKPENIENITNDHNRANFAEKCFRRGKVESSPSRYKKY